MTDNYGAAGLYFLAGIHGSIDIFGKCRLICVWMCQWFGDEYTYLHIFIMLFSNSSASGRSSGFSLQHLVMTAYISGLQASVGTYGRYGGNEKDATFSRMPSNIKGRFFEVSY